MMPEVMRAAPAETVQAARDWLRTLEQCVAAADYERGRGLFTDDVVAFGSRANLIHGLEALQANQWSGVWPNITDFRFLHDQLDCRGDAGLALAVVPWASTGYHAGGTRYDRPGRATIVLERRDGAWRAVHTHFSLTPGTPIVSKRN